MHSGTHLYQLCEKGNLQLVKNFNKIKVLKIIFIVSACGFLCGLMAFAYMGTFIRLVGDDYFLAALLKSHGFWGAQVHSYMNHVYFHGNRFTQTFILLFFSLFPPKISGVIPLITTIYLIFAVYFFISTVLSHLTISYPRLILLNSSFIISFFTLHLAPTIKQGLYWRASMVSSFGTNIGSLLLGALILWKKPVKWFWFPLILLFSFLNAGLSENGAAYQGMMSGILLLFSIYLRFKKSKYFSRTLLLTLTALLGTISAVIIMWLSPGISIFKKDMSNSLLDSIILSFFHMYNFYKEMVLSWTLEIAILVLLGVLIFYLIYHNGNYRYPPKNNHPIFWAIQIFIVQILNMLFILALMLPSAYTRNAYPDPRHFMGAILAFVLAYLVTGFYFGAFLHTFISRSRVVPDQKLAIVGMLVFLLLSLSYPLSAIPKITSERLLFKYWSMQWDNRHEKIINAAEAGEKEIHVIQLDHIIENVSELGPDPTSPTYNEPASIYYGITIYADLPGWDEGFREFRDKNKLN